MDNNYYFDDIVVANDPAVAEEFRLKTWTPKREHEVGCKFVLKNLSSAVASRVHGAASTRQHTIGCSAFVL